MPKISVLLPVYNSVGYIKEAIESVLIQTFSDFELLIIDDGSDYKCDKIIKVFDDNRIKYFEKEHTGLPNTLNYGIRLAEAELIARMDADDIAMKNRLEIQYNFLLENNDYGVVGGNFILINEYGETLSKVIYSSNDSEIKEQLNYFCCICHPSIMIRKDLLNKVNGYNNVKIEDWDLYLRLKGLTKFYNIPQYLIKLRIHSNNLSKPTEEFKQAEEDIVRENAKKIIQNSNNSLDILVAYFSIGHYLYYNQRFEEANEAFNKALRIKKTIRIYRYYFFSKYLKNIVIFYRKHKVYKILAFLKYFDKNAKFTKSI
ncbi:MAG: glycosyltransferase [Ignavibacteria bacterium]|nr:glycosyltransferase [Ignavibacteria bacterium]